MGAVASGVTGLAEGVGIPAALAGPLGTATTGALEGSALGAGEATITGGNVAQGAEFGALSGGIAGGVGGLVSGAGGVAPPTAVPGSAGPGALTGAGLGGQLAAGGVAPVAPASAASGGAPLAAASGVSAPTLSGPDAVPGTSTAGITGSSAVTGAPTQSALPGDVGAGASAGMPTTVGEVTVAPEAGAPTGPVTGAPPVSAAGLGSNSVTGPQAVGPLAPPPPDVHPVTGSTTTPGPFSDPKTLASMGLMGADLLLGNRPPAFENQLNSIAGRDAAQSRQLEGYVNSGQLPSGMQLNLNIGADAARASVRSQYASRGMTGSSAEAQDLAAVGEREAGQAAEIAQQLYSLGLQEGSQADQIYLQLMQTQIAQDKNATDAITNFTTALARSAQPVVPQVGAG